MMKPRLTKLKAVDGFTDLTVEQVSACLRCGKGRMVRSHGLLSNFWRHYQRWLAGKCLFSIGESSMNCFFLRFQLRWLDSGVSFS